MQGNQRRVHLNERLKLKPLIKNMAPLGRPITYFHRRQKEVQFQLVRTVCVFIFVLATTLVIINLSERGNSENQEINNIPNNILKKTANTAASMSKKAKTLHLQGTNASYIEIYALLESLSNPELITELNLEFIQFDAHNFTETLKRFTSLEKISLKKVKIAPGSDYNFSRVFLPNLKEFFLDLEIGFRDQYTDYMQDLLEENVFLLLFYDKISVNAPVDLGEKLSMDKVQITLRVDGWTALSVKSNKSESYNLQETAELILAVKFADKLLSKLIQYFRVTHLTMTECSISKSSFVETIKYLNLYRVNIIDGDIMDVFSSMQMPQLTDLYLELRNATLNISSIPKTVKTLSIGDITNAAYKLGDNCTAEMVGLSSPLDVDIIFNFEKIFLNVMKVAVFEPQTGTQHLLLKNILKTQVKWILLEGFERLSNKNDTTHKTLTEVENEMEEFLENLGVASNERHILLVQDKRTLTWTQMQLTKSLKLQFRYDILGWNKYITWETFFGNF